MSAAHVWIGIVAVLGLAAVFAPRRGIVARTVGWLARRRQARLEDALKHILALERRGVRATPESVTGAVGLAPSRTRSLIERMEAEGWLESTSGALALTPEGREYSLQVVRAHRLWERYLGDETDLPLAEIHGAADRVEHRMSAEDADALDARLGHPPVDPHGDPIPTSDGRIAPFPGVPLTDYPVGAEAEVLHLEDEPPDVLQAILRRGISPGRRVRIVGRRSGTVLVECDGREVVLPSIAAANVHVGPAGAAGEVPSGVIALSDLRFGDRAEVVGIDSAVRGLTRRRLLDLGVTPGASIRPALVPLFGRPRAFLIRNTLIALRDEQARAILVHPLSDENGSAGGGTPNTRGKAS